MSTEKQVFEFERSGNILIVVPTGSLMEFRDNEVRNAYNATYRFLSDPEVRHLLIDFSQLEYFASTFVGMLIRLAKKARQDGGEAVLCRLSDNMRKMMKTLMLLENTKTDFFWVPYPSREAAIAALAEKDGSASTAPEQVAEQSAVNHSAAKQNTASEEESSGGGWGRFA